VGKLPESFDDWKWPWDKGEVDEEKAARLIFNARKAEETATDKVKVAEEKLTTTTAELDAEKARKSGTDEDGQKQIQALTQQVRELETAKTKLETEGRPEDKLENARLSVALELGLTDRDAKRLVGKDRDELLKDGKIFAKEHNLLDDDEDDDDTGAGGEDGDITQPPVRQPLRTGTRRTDPVSKPSDTAAAAKALPPLWQ